MSDDTKPAESEPKRVEPNYAMVEIFGHRQHFAEIRDVEITGGKLLEVRDVDTQKCHLYGSGAIFSLTMLTPDDIEAHIKEVKRRREMEERWRSEARVRRLIAQGAEEGVEEEAEKDDFGLPTSA